ncbi:MAG: AzlD domain-containing protein [Chloroflexota bacterium]
MSDVRGAVLLVILGAGLVTVVPRVLPLVVLSRVALPAWLIRWLGYMPIAVLAALLAQAVLVPDGALALSPDNLSLLAVLPTLLVAIMTRSLLGTVLCGVTAMALLRLLAG